jgi:ATP-dependent Clp protease adaptor protein ClpS
VLSAQFRIRATGGSNPPSEAPLREGETALVERQKVELPRRFVVVFHNDDYTTQEFVIHVLQEVFHKDAMAATQIMLEVHHKGWGVVGTYSRDVAETKVERAVGYARQEGHPLKVTAEPEGYGGQS